MTTLVYCPSTVHFLGLADWSASLDEIFPVKLGLKQWTPQIAGGMDLKFTMPVRHFVSSLGLSELWVMFLAVT